VTPSHDRAADLVGRRRLWGAVAVVLVLGGSSFAGCSIVTAVKKVVHNVETNKATIDTFTNKMKSAEATSFEADYATTGSSPATIVYAVAPPKGLAFKETPTGGSSKSMRLDIIVGSSGAYSCSPPSSPGSPWSCRRFRTAKAGSLDRIYGFYTPAHWVAFLRDFALAAGFAGDKVFSSTMTVNQFHMSCVDLRAPGVPGTSTICTTAEGILGYVKVASDATSFEITRYSSSPQASLFDLPPGAKVTTVKTKATGTT